MSELVGDLENVRLCDLLPPIVNEVSGGIRLFILLGGCDRCL